MIKKIINRHFHGIDISKNRATFFDVLLVKNESLSMIFLDFFENSPKWNVFVWSIPILPGIFNKNCTKYYTTFVRLMTSMHLPRIHSSSLPSFHTNCSYYIQLSNWRMFYREYNYFKIVKYLIIGDGYRSENSYKLFY